DAARLCCGAGGLCGVGELEAAALGGCAGTGNHRRAAQPLNQSEAMARRPKPISTEPETRDTHRAKAAGRRRLARATPALSTSHQSREPTKTPRTTSALPEGSVSSARPSPAKMATKDRMVAGLAMVRAKV